MPYITIPIQPKSYQISFEDILFGISEEQLREYNNFKNNYNTKTVYRINTPQKLIDTYPIESMIKTLSAYVRDNKSLYDVDRETLFQTFYCEKKSDASFTLLMKGLLTKSTKHIENIPQIYKNIRKYITPMISNHSTKEDNEIEKNALSQCVNELSNAGINITKEDFKGIMKKYYRRIDAPCGSLKKALSQLKNIFEYDLYAMYHTSAYAYVKGRTTLSAIKQHQQNNSRWFLKLDFSNFFGSVTKEFAIKQLEYIFPYNEILNDKQGRIALEKALDLCFLNNSLPQGTPISPMLTNIIMIPIDHAIAKMCRENSPHLHYTRYADDLLISSDISFRWSKVQSEIENILTKWSTPFTLNQSKTRYGSSAGRNWNLGLMLNKDNQITVGNQKKKALKTTLYRFIKDCTDGNHWDLNDVQVLCGQISYYKSIEKENIEQIITNYSTKFNFNVENKFKEILKGNI